MVYELILRLHWQITQELQMFWLVLVGRRELVEEDVHRPWVLLQCFHHGCHVQFLSLLLWLGELVQRLEVSYCAS